MAVIIPAHNEARRILRCLASVQAAVSHLKAQCLDAPQVRIVVVLDSCTDGTSRAIAAVSGVDTIRVAARRVGAARHAGVRHVLRESGGNNYWLASTDADTTVPSHWLTAMIALSRGGADLVLGTVMPARGLHPEILRRWQARHSDTDGHPHVHGANLGISSEAYLALGGWPKIATGEDTMLVRRAEAAGLTIARTGSITVRTSSRLSGRAPKGFAAYLAALASATQIDAA